MPRTISVQLTNMSCDIEIMQDMEYPVFTKTKYGYYGGNRSMSIEVIVLGTSVPHTKEHYHHIRTVANVIICFTILFRTKANNMQQQHIHKSNEP